MSKPSQSSSNKVVTLAPGQRIAFATKERGLDTLFIKNEGGRLCLSVRGAAVASVHSSLAGKRMPPVTDGERTTHDLEVLKSGSVVEVTTPEARNRAHVYLVESNGKIKIAGGSPIIERIEGESLPVANN